MMVVRVGVIAMSDVPEIVQELVQRFEANIERYKGPNYKEEDLT